MPKKMKRATFNKLKPWPDSIFDMKITKDKYPTHLALTVFLERRAKGKYGRLELAKFFIAPKRKQKHSDTFFDRLFSYSLRHKTYREIIEKMNFVGVPEELQQKYINAHTKECPIPTQEELFLEEIDNPVFKIILSDDIKKLSYFKTGVPELTKADNRFIKQRTDSFEYKDKNKSDQFMKLLFGRNISL